MGGPETWSAGDLGDEDDEMLDAFLGDAPTGDDVQSRLARIVWKRDTGRPLTSDDIALLVDGAARHLSNPKTRAWVAERGRAARDDLGIQIQQALLASRVQFYRRLLPAFDGRKAPTQVEIARTLGTNEAYVKAADKGPVLSAMIYTLLDQEGMEGVKYDHITDRLVSI